MSQGAVRSPDHVQRAHLEEARLFEGAVVELFYQWPGLRPLDLEAESLARARIVEGALVAIDLHVIATTVRVVFDPVGHRGTAHDVHLGITEAEDDHVAYQVARRRAGDELLGLVVAET